jgi:hypothetical protein
MTDLNNLIDAWGCYFFQTGEDLDKDKFFKVEQNFAKWNVYENVVDDINEFRFSGSLEDCVDWCEQQGAYNYDPLVRFRGDRDEESR